MKEDGDARFWLVYGIIRKKEKADTTAIVEEVSEIISKHLIYLHNHNVIYLYPPKSDLFPGSSNAHHTLTRWDDYTSMDIFTLLNREFPCLTISANYENYITIKLKES